MDQLTTGVCCAEGKGKKRKGEGGGGGGKKGKKGMSAADQEALNKVRTRPAL